MKARVGLLQKLARLRRPSIGRVLMYAAIGLFIAGAGLVWVNLIDDRLEPVPDELAYSPPVLAPADNGVFTLIGVRAAPDEDPHRAGQAAFNAARDWGDSHRIEPGNADGQQSSTPEFRPTQLTLIGKRLQPCNDALACFDSWLDAQSDVKLLASRNARLALRCETVVSMRVDEDIPFASASAPILVPAPLSECSDLLFAKAILLWNEGSTEDALREVLRIRAFNRHVLDGSRSVVTASVAMKRLAATALCISEMVARRPGLEPLAREALVEPVNLVLTQRRWIQTELSWTRSTVLDLWKSCIHSGRQDLDNAEFKRFVCRHIPGYLPNATWNEIQSNWMKISNSLDKPAPAALEAVDEIERESSGRWHWRNRLGAGMQGGPIIMRRYLARAYDTELHRHALSVALDVAARRIAEKDIPAVLASAAQPTSVRGRLRWDADKRRIVGQTWEESIDGSVKPGWFLSIAVAGRPGETKQGLVASDAARPIRSRH